MSELMLGMPKALVTGQIIVCGSLISYSVPEAPEGLQLPDDMKIVPWTYLTLFLLTIKGVPVASPNEQLYS
jgi:hypothetical protein